jgi:hypothetical protein
MHGKFSQQLSDYWKSRFSLPRTLAGDSDNLLVPVLQIQVRLGQPVVDQDLEVLLAAHALNFSLVGQQGMPGEDLQVVEPAVSATRNQSP